MRAFFFSKIGLGPCRTPIWILTPVPSSAAGAQARLKAANICQQERDDADALHFQPDPGKVGVQQASVPSNSGPKKVIGNGSVLHAI